MEDKLFQLEIVSPDMDVYSGTVSSVQVQGSDGRFQVLVDHAPLISTLASGPIYIEQEDGEKKEFETVNGIIEVRDNKVIILVEQVLSGIEVEEEEE